MHDKTVLITGIHGFIGMHLARILRARFPGMPVFGLELPNSSGDALVYQADLLDRNQVISVLQKVRPDVIYHLAGTIFSQEWQDLYLGNVVTTINLLESVRLEVPVCRVVIPGSAAEYGLVAPGELPIAEARVLNPVSPYGVAKAWQTTVARYYATQGLEAVIGRIFNVIGRGASNNLSIGAFIHQLEQIKRGEHINQITVGNLSPKRDFIDVEDACAGLIALAEHGNRGEVYNICSGTSFSLEKILALMIERSGINASVIIDPRRFKSTDIADIYGSYTKAFHETGWQPKINLPDSIDRLFS